MEPEGVAENRGWALSYQKPELGFSVLHQKVHLDINPTRRKLRGSTEITISPHSADLKTLRINCRQCELNRLSINGKPSASMTYIDPYKHGRLRWKAGVHQYHMLQERLEGQLRVPPAEPELVVNLPKSIRILELDSDTTLDRAGKVTGDPTVVDLIQNTKTAVDQVTRFTPIILSIDFSIDELRDGMHFVGWGSGDLQFPHAYSQNSVPGAACCLFPCLDALDSRSTWEISIKCPRTIGDAFNMSNNNSTSYPSSEPIGTQFRITEVESLPSFSEEEQALDLVVICSGDMTDEVSKSTNSFQYRFTDRVRSWILKTPARKQHLSYV